ncbi:hypothetical protein QE380_000145 [Acinetobacter baylyi]|uniref:Uncharacterized protein n=1 Tax=Acinetobacter baylyi TaxID=202950 RepID=A0ABU0URQ9_ACIBI|nr:hypothetical protein [Acinetobacter baylyi]MDQ1207222.1 hypothetical protein [Acinetobacter baylyi]MDR6105696.1 hypothetical protein [Acinetobacter baylyi]MDR6187584.1 hypothetical protein [Acinetobacter baylyi]
MTKIISKGGFRERANRSRGYKQSENQQTQLTPNKYQPPEKPSKNIDIQQDQALTVNTK